MNSTPHALRNNSWIGIPIVGILAVVGARELNRAAHIEADLSPQGRTEHVPDFLKATKRAVRHAIVCFDYALDDVGIADPVLRRTLYEYFAWATTHSMASYPESADKVPSNLRIPHWSWDGLQR